MEGSWCKIHYNTMCNAALQGKSVLAIHILKIIVRIFQSYAGVAYGSVKPCPFCMVLALIGV